MNVVKFSDSSNAAERHFQKGHSRCIVDVFGPEPRRCSVHHFAPGPKAVINVPGAVFGAAADHTLKSMGVCINQTREESAVLEANSALDFAVRSETQNATNLVANKGDVALKTAARVN